MKEYLMTLGTVVLAAFSVNTQAATLDFQSLESLNTSRDTAGFDLIVAGLEHNNPTALQNYPIPLFSLRVMLLNVLYFSEKSFYSDPKGNNLARDSDRRINKRLTSDNKL